MFDWAQRNLLGKSQIILQLFSQIKPYNRQGGSYIYMYGFPSNHSFFLDNPANLMILGFLGTTKFLSLIFFYFNAFTNLILLYITKDIRYFSNLAPAANCPGQAKQSQEKSDQPLRGTYLFFVNHVNRLYE